MQFYSNDINYSGYCEYLCAKPSSAKAIIVKVIIIILAVLISAFMLFMTLSTIPTVSFMLLAIIAFIAWFAFQFTNIEYEYVIATGILELSKIYGARTRKKVLEIAMSQIEAICATSDLQGHNVSKKNILFTCRSDDQTALCLIYTDKAIKKALVISCPTKTVTCLKHYKRNAFTNI